MKAEQQSQSFELRQSLLLLTAAIIWGTSFISQNVGMNFLGPFSFIAIRSLLAAFVLFPLSFVFTRLGRSAEASLASEMQAELTWRRSPRNHMLISGGVLCGLVVFFASNFQQLGMQYTSVGKTGFITGFYIVLVPIASVFLGRKIQAKAVFAVFVAFIGLSLLSLKSDWSIGFGEILVFLGAVFFTFHILIIDHYVKFADGIRLSIIQFFVCGILSLIVALFKETITADAIWQAAGPLFYSGVMSCAAGYTLQIVGQRGVSATKAALIFSLEAPICALSGWLILSERLNAKEILGSALMFSAILLLQIPSSRRKALGQSEQGGGESLQ